MDDVKQSQQSSVVQAGQPMVQAQPNLVPLAPRDDANNLDTLSPPQQLLEDLPRKEERAQLHPPQGPPFSIQPAPQVPVIPEPEEQFVGVSHKEQLVGTMPAPIESVPTVMPSEVEPELSKEVQEVGVEAVSEKPNLTPEHIDAGITHAKESVPVVTVPTGTVQLPMTEEEAKQVVRLHRKVTESILWFATTVLRQIKIAHQKVTNKNI